MVAHDRYRLLDELRGVAAVAVLVFHIGTRGGGPVLLQNGYLAVDFFFMLSGFVLAEAYERRLAGRLSFAGFAARRLIRMAPVAMLGALIGGAYLVARVFAAPQRSDPLSEVLAGNLLNMLILPKLWHGRATGWELFPANGPLWSLFFEIAANLAWAAFLAGRSTRMVASAVAASAVLLVLCGLGFGTLHLGWEATSLIGGFARVGYGFGAGLLLHRLRAFLPVMDRRAAVIALLALVYFLALPIARVGWELAVTLVCLPAVLAGGALLGRLSYPLYGIHLPLIAMLAGALKYGGGAGATHWASLLLVPALLALSHAVLVWLDEPARAWLTRRLLAPVDSPPLARPENAPRRASGAGTGSEVNLSPGDEAAPGGYAPAGWI
jgi:peptidoglycan/LPS O-acetylase OafA/YrhL